MLGLAVDAEALETKQDPLRIFEEVALTSDNDDIDAEDVAEDEPLALTKLLSDMSPLELTTLILAAVMSENDGK